jgi:hypothetical protein
MRYPKSRIKTSSTQYRAMQIHIVKYLQNNMQVFQNLSFCNIFIALTFFSYFVFLWCDACRCAFSAILNYTAQKFIFTLRIDLEKSLIYNHFVEIYENKRALIPVRSP